MLVRSTWSFRSGQGEYNVITTEAAVWGALLFSPAIIDVSIFSAFARRVYNEHTARYTMTTLFLSACCTAWLGDRIVRDTTSRLIVLHRSPRNRIVSSRLQMKILILKQSQTTRILLLVMHKEHRIMCL